MRLFVRAGTGVNTLIEYPTCCVCESFIPSLQKRVVVEKYGRKRQICSSCLQEIQRAECVIAEDEKEAIQKTMNVNEPEATAAPEMLAILEELRESSTCCGTYDLLEETTWASPDLVDRIEAAIRKARGEE